MVSAESTRTSLPAQRSATLPLVILMAGTFAMGTDSFVLAGIIPDIAAGLKVSAGSAGQVVTTFALTYGLLAPVLATITSRFARKNLLIAALAIFILANAASAASPSLAALLITRVVAGLGAAMFTPNASAAAASLVAPERRGRALSMVLGGLTIGTVVGVPIGTTLGQHLSWRAGLIFVAAVGLVALIGVFWLMPALPQALPVPLRDRLQVLADGLVVRMVSVILIGTVASIGVYTYIAEVLDDTAGIHGTTLAAILLVWGAGGAVGSFGSGALTDRYGSFITLAAALGLLTATLALLTVAHNVVAVFVVMALNGAAAWSMATPNNHRLTVLKPDQPSVVISFNSAGIYLGQAVGAFAAGIYLDEHYKAKLMPLIGAAAALVALASHLVGTREKRPVGYSG